MSTSIFLLNLTMKLKHKDNTTLKIAFLTSSFPRFPNDSLVEYLYHLARRLARGVKARVEVVVPSDTRPHEFPARDGVTVRPFRYFFPASLQRLAYGNGMPDNLRSSLLPRLQVPFFLLAFLVAGYRAACKADRIYAHWLVPAGFIGACLARLLGKEMVLTLHSGGLHFLRRRTGGRQLASFICRSSRRITVTCRRQAKILLELLPPGARDGIASRITILPMGIDYGSYQSSFQRDKLRSRYRLRTPFTVIFMGRLVSIKGVSVLLQALAGRNDVTLLVLGEGRERSPLERQARELGVIVHFAGMVGGRKKIDYLHLSDIMVLPSLVLSDGRTEGLPVSLLEGMAAGLPVIASRVGGIAEILEDGKNGFLVSPGNSRELCQKLDELLADSGLRDRVGKEARRRAAAYDWDKLMPIFNNLLL